MTTVSALFVLGGKKIYRVSRDSPLSFRISGASPF